MSDTVMIDRGHTKSTKVARPDLYFGDRKKLEDWILQFDLYFKFADDEVDDVEKASFIATFMRGHAANWVKPYLVKYLDPKNNEDDIIKLFEDYTEFKDRLRKAFGTANETAIATRQIQRLKQTTSAADYATIFQQYSVNTGWDDSALMAMFKQGLKSDVRAELMRTGAGLEKLEDLINEAVRLDNQLHEFKLENQRHQSFNNKATHTTKKYDHRHYTRTMFPRVERPRHPDAMEIDVLTQGTGKKEFKKSAYNKKTLTCYSCGKPGHIARNCRSKNKVVRQLNVIETDEHDNLTEDEWEVVRTLDDMQIERLCEPEETDTPEGQIRKTTKIEVASEEGEIVEESDSPDSRMYEDPDDRSEYDEDEMDISPRASTPHPNTGYLHREETKKAQTPGVWKFLQNHWRYNQSDQSTFWNDEHAKQEIQEQLERELEIRYDFDDRNPLHLYLHWGYCVHDHCLVHKLGKDDAEWLPRNKDQCKWMWLECNEDLCEWHLWDKRAAQWFPGKEEGDIFVFRMLINKSCILERWQVCLNPECEKHKDVKERNGFGNEPFLGVRMTPPKSPEKLVPSTKATQESGCPPW